MTPDDLRNRFSSHVLSAKLAAELQQVREALHEAATRICTVCPDGRELSLALTKLEEAMYWANAGIARRAPVQETPAGKFKAGDKVVPKGRQMVGVVTEVAPPGNSAVVFVKFPSGPTPLPYRPDELEFAPTPPEAVT